MEKNKLIEYDYYVTNALTNVRNKNHFIGIDEVGRGALAGPVIACAFSWKNCKNTFEELHNLKVLLKLNDSKQLNVKERKKLYKSLIKLGDFSLGYASVLEINKLNILNATFLAMKRAFDGLIKSIENNFLEPFILIDGNKFNPYINCRQLSIIGGDAKSALIASASIIAKIYRDMLMKKLSKHKKFKLYRWNRNVGYGTLFHRTAIKKHGLTPLHRKLFVRKVLNTF
ncbi:MAG: ribonuclease HII [Candidatus Melainabacteria bacterium]|nr:ribonuclease HII [Candidatus Melainabacteria bacterium]